MADSVGEPKSGLAVFISGIAKRVYDGRKQSPQALALQCLMAYIVDLSLVMRRLFSEMQGSQTISQHKLSEVLREYGDSSLRLQVHTEISIFVNKGDIHEPIRKDKVLDEVVELLEKYRFDPLDEAHESHNDYPFVDLTGFLGKLSQPPTATGGNSDVFKTSLIPGPHGHSEQLVAVQVLRCVGTLDDSLERLNKRLLREAHVWNRLNYIHVVPLLGLSSHGSLPCLITPWYENGNALNYISKNTEIDKSSLVAGCIDGVVYLHSRTPPVVHGDLKASNILVDNNGNARITDFGTSKILQEEPTGFTTSSGVHGTHRWMAPELLINSSPPSTTTDIYSLTLLVLEIYTQKIPFAALNQYAFFNAINKKLSPKRSHYQPFDPPEKLWRAFEKGWSYDPRQRPSALIFKAMFSATLAETGWRCS
ncbi:hypothetical protein FRC02_012162 [Tulasnella sp. 418]|nr:hypothetical protein FRC02_012162 [Tulasnella sp. 418]